MRAKPTTPCVIQSEPHSTSMNEAKNFSERRICKWIGLFSVFVYCLLSPVYSFSQESKGEIYQYARKIVDTLASPSMHGRGYVKNGDKIAAKYIAEEFKKIGLLSLKKLQTGDPKKYYKNYLQYFEMSVNTFPSKMDLSINGKKMVPGKDFIINSLSGSRKGTFKDIKWQKTLIEKPMWDSIVNDQYGKKALFISDSTTLTMLKKDLSLFSEDRPPLVFLLNESKLTMHVSPRIQPPGEDDLTTSRICAIEILKNSIPPEPHLVKVNIKHKLIEEYTSQNIIGYVKGSQFPDSFIVYSAHYDHLGRMGKDTYFPGANDNASGIAMLLNLAKYYSTHPPKYSIVFMAFGGEEAGLVGSKFYTEHPWFPLKHIKFLVNFDIMGTGEEGIKVVNATEFNDQFKMLVKLNAQNSYLKEVQPRGKTANSDHYFFYLNGVKCFYIYTLGGIKAYHDIYDKAETLPLTKFESAFKLMTEFTDWLQEK